MKRRLIQFVTTYFLFVLIFVLQKPIFMGYYHTLYNKVSWTDYFSVMGHGLPLDFSLAGYLTAIPGLLLIASVWIQPAGIPGRRPSPPDTPGIFHDNRHSAFLHLYR